MIYDQGLINLNFLKIYIYIYIYIYILYKVALKVRARFKVRVKIKLTDKGTFSIRDKKKFKFRVCVGSWWALVIIFGLLRFGIFFGYSKTDNLILVFEIFETLFELLNKGLKKLCYSNWGNLIRSDTN